MVASEYIIGSSWRLFVSLDLIDDVRSDRLVSAKLDRRSLFVSRLPHTYYYPRFGDSATRDNRTAASQL
jgi:hypothetical protein